MNNHIIRYHNTFCDLALKHRATAQPDPPLLIWKDFIDDIKRPLADMIHGHHDFFTLYVVERGKGIHVIEGVSYAVARGDVYVMGLDTVHYYRRCHDLLVQGFYFSPAIFDMATWEALAAVPGLPSLVPGLMAEKRERGRAGRWLHLTPDAYAQVADQMTKLNGEWDAQRPGSSLMLRGLFTCFLIRLARFQSEAHPRQVAIQATAHGGAVSAAIQKMEERYAEDLRIEQVAASVFLSRQQFAKIFVQAVGQTPRDYLRHIRIERAKSLLASTNLSMTVISEQSGMSDSAYFSRVFHAATGMTPSRFRRQAQAASSMEVVNSG